MSAEPSTARLWLVRVVIPAAVIIGAGTILVWRPTAVHRAPGPESRERLRSIGLAINDATPQLGRPPENADDLRPFLREHGDPDELLESPTDGRSYVVLWGVDVRTVGLDTVLAYEQIGAGGSRFVLTASRVTQLTDAELAGADFPPGHRPPGKK